MSIFYPGSTPEHTFTLPFSAENCLIAHVSYRQGNKTILTKSADVFAETGRNSCAITVEFSQAESLRFDDFKDISAQINLITVDQKRHPSVPILINAGVQYERKVIADG